MLRLKPCPEHTPRHQAAVGAQLAAGAGQLVQRVEKVAVLGGVFDVHKDTEQHPRFLRRVGKASGDADQKGSQVDQGCIELDHGDLA